MKLSKRQFGFALLLLLLIFAALNYAVAFATRNSVPRAMAHARDSSGSSTLALGNSLIQVGFDEQTFNNMIGTTGTRQATGAVNLGLGGSTAVEQLLMLRYALRSGIHPRLLIYGFYDFQLTSPVTLTTHDLIGTHAMLYYLEPEYARSLYHLSFHDRIEFEIMRHFPVAVERGTIWAKVEKLRRHIAEQGMPGQETNRFGRATDFALLEATTTDEFTRECNSAIGLNLSPPVQEIIHQGSEAGARVLFVEMPMRPEHVQLYYDTPAWHEYLSRLRELLRAENVTYIDASTWITNKTLFQDHLHLTEQGAKDFSAKLAEYILTGGTPGSR